MITYAIPRRRFINFCFCSLSKNRKLLQAEGSSYALANSQLFKSRSYTNVQTKYIFLNSNSIQLIISRHKSKSKKNKFDSHDQSDEDESGDDEDESGDGEDEFEGKGLQVKTYTLRSLRIDFVLKSIFRCSRSKIEKSFYENKIRINGGLLLKKGANVKVGDEFDMIKGLASENPDFLTIERVEILSVGTDTETNKFLVRTKKWKSLLIDNYSGAGRWKP